VTVGDGFDDPGAAKSYKTATPRKTRSIRPLHGYRPFIAPKMEYREPLAPTRAPIRVEYEGVADVKQGYGRTRKRTIEEEQDFEMASEMGHGSIIYTMDVRR
jgi:hypothetical protein